ncbi:MAG: selenium metabolism-associated LysR family transcriptional regulator [Bacillota bacterium]
MNDLQLKIFLLVAALKSFSRAAEQLYISQPSVSMRVKCLEEELGTQLFDRSRSRELTLTEDGKEYLDYAQRIVNLQEEALARLNRSEKAAAGPVHLGASSVPGIYLLPPTLARFKRLFPAVSINLNILDSAQVVEQVINYDVDLGFVGSMHQDDRLAYRVYANDELVLITPPGHFQGAGRNCKQAHKRSVTLTECLSGNLLLREKGSATRDLFEKILAGQGMSLRDFAAVTHVGSLEAIKQGVRYGLGISLVSRHSAADYLQMGFVDGFTLAGIDLARQLYLVRHSGRVLNRAAVLLMKQILENL